MEPGTQQIIQLSLTATSKHGCQHMEDVMRHHIPRYEHLHPRRHRHLCITDTSSSTRLTCVLTRWSHAPSKSSNCRSPHPPNMDASIGKMPCLLSCLFMSNCKRVQTSSKHQLLPHLASLVTFSARATKRVGRETRPGFVVPCHQFDAKVATRALLQRNLRVEKMAASDFSFIV